MHQITIWCTLQGIDILQALISCASVIPSPCSCISPPAIGGTPVRETERLSYNRPVLALSLTGVRTIAIITHQEQGAEQRRRVPSREQTRARAPPERFPPRRGRAGPRPRTSTAPEPFILLHIVRVADTTEGGRLAPRPRGRGAEPPERRAAGAAGATAATHSVMSLYSSAAVISIMRPSSLKSPPPDSCRKFGLSGGFTILLYQIP